jgi:hypothetical protein
VARLIGFSLGLAALTAWGIRRYDALRTEVELPAVTDPGYGDAVAAATVDISTSALAETFIGAAIALAAAVMVAFLLSGRIVDGEVG